jgi:hypothetical protein
LDDRDDRDDQEMAACTSATTFFSTAALQALSA